MQRSHLEFVEAVYVGDGMVRCRDGVVRCMDDLCEGCGVETANHETDNGDLCDKCNVEVNGKQIQGGDDV